MLINKPWGIWWKDLRAGVRECEGDGFRILINQELLEKNIWLFLLNWKKLSTTVLNQSTDCLKVRLTFNLLYIKQCTEKIYIIQLNHLFNWLIRASLCVFLYTTFRESFVTVVLSTILRRFLSHDGSLHNAGEKNTKCQQPLT